MSLSYAQASQHWQVMNEEIRQIRETRNVALSPDGKSVLATLSDPSSAGAEQHLWLLDTAGASAARQLTFAADREAGETHAQWAPDGRAVYFISRRKSVARAYRLPMQGGETVELALYRDHNGSVHADWAPAPENGATAHDLDVDVIQVSPDGKRLAIVAEDPKSPSERAKDDAIRVGAEFRKRRLYVIEAGGGDPEEIALADNVTDMRWSPHADRLAILTNANEDDSGPSSRVWLASPAQTADARQVGSAPDTTQRLEWSPDAGRLAYLARCQSEAPPDCSDIYLQDLGAGTVRNLTKSIIGSVSGELAFDHKGRVLTTVRVGMHERLARIDPDTSKITWPQVAEPVTTVIATNSQRSSWALICGGPDRPQTPCFMPAQNGPAQPLKAPEMLPDTWHPVRGTPLAWQNGGLTIEGRLYLPLAALQGKRAPLIVHVHGGPSYMFQDRFYAIVNLLVERGWAVLQANPRGSQGYGTSFLAANRDDLGGEDYRDIMAGVDAAIQHFPIDPQRLALIGYSYGGTMAAFALGKTDRFRALVSGAPVIDQLSEYGQEDSSWYDRWYFGKPWERLDAAWRQSPLAGVGSAHTPLLLLQGMSDITDPPGQTLEIYRALRQLDRPVELVQYPREDHRELHHNFFGEPSREPWHGVDLRRRMIEFIADAFAKGAP